jgi:tripartite-type tricarboxylate transporter receptor subunit TctC
MNDLVAGSVDALCDQSTTAVPQIQGGRIRAYAVTSAGRLDVLKDVPSAKEAGLGVEMTIWHGLYAPKGTPAAALDKLNGALQTALGDATILERFKGFGTTTFPADERSRAAHGARFKGEVAKWAAALKAAGVTPAEVK